MRRVADAGIGLLLAVLLGGCATTPESSCPTIISEKPKATAKEPDGVVQVLQRRIQERDRRIAELTNTLDALKHIDNDMRTNKKVQLTPQPSPR